jgi:quercetin dioxygenase-like cupin family protein
MFDNVKRLVLVLALAAAGGSAAVAAAGSAPPPGSPVPAKLVGLYEAHFGGNDSQTAGTWHLRLGPGHKLEIWNTADAVANSPRFEGGPVSFRGNRMVFARVTAQGVCSVGAIYAWTYEAGQLRFRVVGKDDCQPRLITFPVHPWRRVTGNSTPITAKLFGAATVEKPFTIQTSGAAGLLMLRAQVAPGGSFGWHYHRSAVAVMVTAGTLTLYDSGDANCAAQQVTAGHGFVEAANHVHLARNEGTKPVTLYVTYLGLPKGEPPDQPAAKPSQCPS